MVYPISKPDPTRRRTTMRINGSLMDRLKKVAEAEHRSTSNLVELLLREGVDRRSRKPTASTPAKEESVLD
jgi:hypothetical protein